MGFFDFINKNKKGVLENSKEVSKGVKTTAIESTSTNFSYTDLSFLNPKESDFSFLKHNIDCATKVEVIDSILKYIAGWFIQGEILTFDKNGKQIEDDELVQKIKNPNQFQTYEDFLAQWVYFLKANGQTIIRPYSGSIGYEKDIDRISLFNLNPDYTFHPKNTKSIFEIDNKNQIFKYVEEIQSNRYSNRKLTHSIKYNSALNFVDVVSGISENKYTGSSPIASLHDELKNIHLSKIAQRNKTNLSGITLISPEAKEGAMSMGMDKPVVNNSASKKTQKDLIEENLRSRGITSDNSMIVSPFNLKAQNLTKDLENLQFEEEAIPSYRRIYRKFGIPEELSGITQNNNALGDSGSRKDAALLSFIQNIIEPLGNNFIRTFEQFFETENSYTMSYTHLPIYQVAKKKALETDGIYLEKIISAKNAGLVTDERAIELAENLDLLK